MKYLLMLSFSLAGSFSFAQSYKVNQCVIEDGLLKTIVSDYDPSTGNYSILVNSTRKNLDEIYPVNSSHYAASADWYTNNETLNVGGKKYVKYGLPRILGTNEIKKFTVFNRIGVYVESSVNTLGEVIYIPVRRGCEFQPYQEFKPEPEQKKIYYNADWKVSSQANAAYYRLITLNAAGKPVGLVKDYYINGAKQWQGLLSFVHPTDNSKDVIEGVCAWFHSNGTKAEEVYYVKGKQQGIYKRWAEDGSLLQEIEYKNGVIHGYVKTYSDQGKLISTERYTNGQPNKN